MSHTASPAKREANAYPLHASGSADRRRAEQRLDKHLQRQRGAGVRNIAATFGFTFGISAAVAADAAAPEEPAGKRRKVENVQVVEEESEIRTRGGEETTVTNVGSDDKTRWRPKARRRLQEVVDSEPAATTTAQCDEESSAMTRKSTKKRGRPKKTLQAPKAATASDTGVVESEPISIARREEETLAVAVEPPKKRGRPKKVDQEHMATTLATIAHRVEEAGRTRPRRHAATAALHKVTEGFIEEEAPIDKKRRDPEPEKTARRRPKRTTVLRETSESWPSTTLPAPDSNNEGLDVGNPKVEEDGCHQPPGLVATRVRTRAPSIQFGDDHIAEAVPKREARKLLTNKTQVKRADCTSTIAKDSTQWISSAARLPLIDTDANATLRSASPEKGVDQDIKSDISPRGTAIGSHDERPVRQNKAPAVGRNSTRQPKDEGPAEAQTTINSPAAGGGMEKRRNKVETSSRKRNEPLADEDASDDRNAAASGTSMQQSPYSRNAATDPTLTKIAVESSPRAAVSKRRKPALTAMNARITAVPRGNLEKETATGESQKCAKDENVDWLFQSHPQKFRPTSSRRTLAAPVIRGFAERKMDLASMAHMDLDEVLSNVAAFVPRGVSKGEKPAAVTARKKR